MNVRGYIPLVLFVLLAVLSFFIVKPLLISIFLGAILAFILYPLYLFLKKKINSTVSALLICLLVLLVIFIPGVFLVKALVQEAFILFISVKQKLAVGLFTECPTELCKTIETWTQNPAFTDQFKEIIRTGTNWIIEKGSNFLVSIPGMILNLFVIFFTMFYFMKDGEAFAKYVNRILSMHHKRYSFIVSRLKDIIIGVLNGYLLVALIQASFAALGYFLFGVSSPLLWAVVTGIFALIPFLGTGIIWIPAGIIMILDGVFQDSHTLVLKGIGLLIYSAIFVASSDNLLRPKLMGDKAKVHPVIILLGVIGGVLVFGIVGVILGPLILSLTSVLIDVHLTGKEVK